MSVQNSLVQRKQTAKFSVAIQSDGYKKLINNTLGDPKKAERFVAAVSSAVAVNPALQECEAGSILSSALLGESLNLSPSPQLGHYFLVPRNNNKKGTKEATFQIGYKGYLQLAMRSGQYLDIDAVEIREGEYKGRDKGTGKHRFEFIEDDEIREEKEIIGYLAYFELLNGFKKSIYWSKTKMEKHADKYSPAFNLEKYKLLQQGKIPQNELWKYSSYWYASFIDMSFKTLLRQLISKWGIMSIEMQKAFEADIQNEQKENAEFVENETIDNFFEGATDDAEKTEEETKKPTSKADKKSGKEDAQTVTPIEEDTTTDDEINDIFGMEEPDGFFDEE